MGSQLHQTLRSLCLDTGWKYAVFWKLKHRARMMLTWEDAYCHNNDNLEKVCPSNFPESFHDGHPSCDPLGLTVAKMSYHVYSLGEGVVGQVAVTGKHLWISADKHVTEFGSPSEYSDAWQTQFSAGIKTIAVVAVVPHGVIQLGTLDLIAEDLKIVNRIRDVFFELQDSLACQTPNALAASMESSCLSDISTRTTHSGVYHDCMQNLDRAIVNNGVDFRSSICSSIEKPGHCSYNFSVPGSNGKKLVEMINKHEAHERTMQECGNSDNFLPPILGSDYVEQQKHEQVIEIGDARHEEKSGVFKNLGECLESRNIPFLKNVCSSSSIHDAAFPADYSATQMSYLPSEILDSTICYDERGMCVSEPLHKDHENALHMPFRFSAGYELYEALGPAFRKQNCHYEWGAENIETDMVVKMSEGMATSSLLKANSGTEHLLEAVVANINNNEIGKSDKSFNSESILNAEKKSEPCTSDIGSLSSAGYSFDRGTLNSLNSSSGACGFRSSKGFSSTSCSRGSENLEKPQESVKVQKKRAKPGESCRPRPRDRQLIQDRIKELRELVPSGSKCSIDSLLERTIKHMIFMQRITEHSEKLNKCAGSKLLDKELRIRGASCTEQGSSWAVEVGSNLNVCPIIVENLSMNGQMLVEMPSEDCSHFLEIAEAIHSMGLIILKGITETCGEKTWMRFVVEGQNNRSFHRMDVLWSLMQLLQPKLNI